MAAYVVRRLLFMIPTILGIMMLSFLLVQFAPGGPVERILAQASGLDPIASGKGSANGDFVRTNTGAMSEHAVRYRGAQGLDEEFIAALEKQFGFDKPAHERFLLMLWNYLRFDFGMSYFQDRPVISLIAEKLPVSISLGLWTMLFSYSVSIPLGIKKATRSGTAFDVWTSAVVILGYALPGFMLAILLIVLFSGGSFLDWFPLRHLTSDNWADLPWISKIADYFWHLTLPLISMSAGSFAVTSLLTRNAFLDEMGKYYVIAARAKGLSEREILYRHIFRNAMLIIIAGLPGAFIAAFFTGSLLIETIFSLDGLGLLSFESIVHRDYPVVFASVYIFSLIGLTLNLVSDLVYMWTDPRIDFERQDM